MIETERLRLVLMSPEYYEDFKVLDMDPEVMKFIRKASSTESEVKERFLRLMSYIEKNPGLGGFAVIDKSTGEMLGMGFLIHIEMNPELNFEVGYRLHKKAWGHGYATELAKGLIAYGFNTMKLQEIYGTTHPVHVVSQKALMKAGLKLIGTAPYHGGTTLFKIEKSLER